MADPSIAQAQIDEARLLSGQPLQFSKGMNAARAQPSYQSYMNNSVALQRYNANIEYSKLPSTIAQNEQMVQSQKGGGVLSSLLPIVAIVVSVVAPGLGSIIGAEILGTSGAIAAGTAVAGAAEAIVGSAVLSGGMTAVQGGTPEEILKSAIVSGAATGIGGVTGQEVASSLPAGTDPTLVKALSGAASGGVGTAIRGGDVVEGALVGGAAPIINAAITGADVKPGTPTTDPYPRGEISITGMEPTITPAPDQGGVPTPPSVDTPIITDINTPITDAEVVAQIQPTGNTADRNANVYAGTNTGTMTDAPDVEKTYKGLNLKADERVTDVKTIYEDDIGRPVSENDPNAIRQDLVTIVKENPNDPNKPYTYRAVYYDGDFSKPSNYQTTDFRVDAEGLPASGDIISYRNKPTFETITQDTPAGGFSGENIPDAGNVSISSIDAANAFITTTPTISTPTGPITDAEVLNQIQPSTSNATITTADTANTAVTTPASNTAITTADAGNAAVTTTPTGSITDAEVLNQIQPSGGNATISTADASNVNVTTSANGNTSIDTTGLVPGGGNVSITGSSGSDSTAGNATVIGSGNAGNAASNAVITTIGTGSGSGSGSGSGGGSGNATITSDGSGNNANATIIGSGGDGAGSSGDGNAAILKLTGLIPDTDTDTPKKLNDDKQVDPFVDIAPTPEKKTDYTKEISILLNALLGDSGNTGVGPRTTDLDGSSGPGSAALAQALRVDAGAPIFGGEKKGKRRNVWNIESLRNIDETGA